MKFKSILNISGLVAVFLLFSGLNSMDVYTGIPKGIVADENIEYIIRLNNGDIITGYIVEFINDPKEGEGLKISTELGRTVVFANQITEIKEKDNFYRHSHRVFLLPTAEPIGDNHFIGSFELLFLYAGAGIGDLVSITAGRSFIPQIPSRHQISSINAKISPLSLEFDTLARKISFAFGANLSFLNDANKLLHFYGVTTVKLYRSMLTASVFYKTGRDDFYFFNLSNSTTLVNYPNGAFGIGLGLDTELPKRRDIHLIGELWNNDVTRPTNTGVLLGFRLANTNMSADFGIAFFTQPYIVPFTSFTWTPF